MFIRFRTLGTLDFVNLRYIAVFNTSGNGQAPLATSINSFANYSFELIFGGTNVGGASYQVIQVVVNGTSSNGGYSQLQVPILTQFVTNFNPNSNGTGNEFTFTFNRFLLTPISTPAPTAVPTGATPAPGPFPGVSTLWDLNFFSTDAQGNPIDAISNQGIQDVSFNDMVVTTAISDQVFNKPSPPPIQVANAAAQVMAIEVINTP
jgi:hypothetical protein